MSDNQKIYLSVWAAWVVLHGYMLAFRYSVDRLVVLALAAVFLLLATVFSKKYEDGTMSTVAGHLLGTSLFVQFGWYFTANILPGIVGREMWYEHVADLFAVKFSSFCEFLCMNARLPIWIGIGVGLFLVRLFMRKWPRIAMLLSYAGNAAIMLPILNHLYASRSIVLLYLAVILVFGWVDLWNIGMEDEWNKCGKRWFNVLSILLLLAHVWDWWMLRALKQSSVLEAIFVQGIIKWYHLAAVGVILVGLCFSYIVIDPAEDSAIVDYKFLSVGVGMLLLSAFLKWFPVGWWWILVLVNLVYLLAEAVIVPVFFGNDDDTVAASWGIQIAVSVISIAAVVLGHFGIGLPVLGLVIGAVVGFGGAAVVEGLDNEQLHLPGYVAAAVSGILIPVMVWLWRYRRLEKFFLVLLLLAAAVLVIAALLSRNVTKGDKKNVLVPVAAVVAFVILSLNVMTVGGSRIRMERNSWGAPVVTVEARDEESRIVSVEYLWKDTSLDTEHWTVKSGEETYISPYALAGKTGRLRVIATDSNGIVTETVFWLSERAES